MKHKYTVPLSIVSAIAILLAVSVPAKGQVDTGAISGTVTDQSATSTSEKSCMSAAVTNFPSAQGKSF